MDQHNLAFTSSVASDNLNSDYNNYSSVIPDWNLMELQSRAVIDNTDSLSVRKQPSFSTSVNDWNVNNSRVGKYRITQSSVRIV